MPTNIGDTIRALRLQNGLSQEELGAKVGVKKAAINKYENGIVVNLKQSVIVKLANALGVTPAFLLGYESKAPAIGERDKYAYVVAEIMAGLTEEQKQQVVEYAKLHEAARNSPKEQK